MAAHAAAGEDVAAQDVEAARFARRALGAGRLGMLHAGEASGAVDAPQASFVAIVFGASDYFFFLAGFAFLASISFWTSQSTSGIS